MHIFNHCITLIDRRLAIFCLRYPALHQALKSWSKIQNPSSSRVNRGVPLPSPVLHSFFASIRCQAAFKIHLPVSSPHLQSAASRHRDRTHHLSPPSVSAGITAPWLFAHGLRRASARQHGSYTPLGSPRTVHRSSAAHCLPLTASPPPSLKPPTLSVMLVRDMNRSRQSQFHAPSLPEFWGGSGCLPA